VWEIGGGLGAMTSGLLERGAELTVFEIDSGFAGVLRDFFGAREGFTLVEGDALKTWRNFPPGDYLFGNLPYTIGAALLADFIEKNRFFRRMVVTVQKEVARRMAARPGSKDYSSFSVLCGSVYTITPLLVMKGASFYPEPRVDSQGVRLDLRTDRNPAAYPVYFRPLLRCLFASRRKTVKNNLESFAASAARTGQAGGKPDGSALAGSSPYLIRRRVHTQKPATQGSFRAGYGPVLDPYLTEQHTSPFRARLLIPEICGEALKDAGIAPNERAERLGIDDFAALALALERALARAGIGEGESGHS
jgi:ribosomal RNA small subunit methyltransferase A